MVAVSDEAKPTPGSPAEESETLGPGGGPPVTGPAVWASAGGQNDDEQPGWAFLVIRVLEDRERGFNVRPRLGAVGSELGPVCDPVAEVEEGFEEPADPAGPVSIGDGARFVVTAVPSNESFGAKSVKEAFGTMRKRGSQHGDAEKRPERLDQQEPVGVGAGRVSTLARTAAATEGHREASGTRKVTATGKANMVRSA
jgi:hypothetical protein